MREGCVCRPKLSISQHLAGVSASSSRGSEQLFGTSLIGPARASWIGAAMPRRDMAGPPRCRGDGMAGPSPNAPLSASRPRRPMPRLGRPVQSLVAPAPPHASRPGDADADADAEAAGVKGARRHRARPVVSASSRWAGLLAHRRGEAGRQLLGVRARSAGLSAGRHSSRAVGRPSTGAGPFSSSSRWAGVSAPSAAEAPPIVCPYSSGRPMPMPMRDRAGR